MLNVVAPGRPEHCVIIVRSVLAQSLEHGLNFVGGSTLLFQVTSKEHGCHRIARVLLVYKLDVLACIPKNVVTLELLEHRQKRGPYADRFDITHQIRH